MKTLRDREPPFNQADIRYLKLRHGYPPPLILKRYMKSPLWWATHDRYQASGLPRCCLICVKRRAQLHHTDYTRLGRERLRSLRPLCNDHHTGLHQTMNRYNIPLERTDDAIRILARNFNVTDIEERLAPFYASVEIPTSPTMPST